MPLNNFEQVSDMLESIQLENHSGCIVGNEKKADKSEIRVFQLRGIAVVHMKDKRAQIAKVEIEKNSHLRYILEKQTQLKNGQGT